MGNHVVAEWVEKNTLRWFGHIERMGSEEFVKVWVQAVEESHLREGVKEYICERGATRWGRLDQARRECFDRGRWRLFCHGHLLGGKLPEEVRHQRSIDW